MFHGSIVALVTPMTADGQIDNAALERLVDFHCEQGTDGIVVAGSTGESATLTLPEKKALIESVVTLAKGRLPIIAGTGASSTQQALELTCMAMDVGVDACLLMTPPYVKPTQEGLYYHFEHIAKHAAVPQILYNVPSRTACDLLPATIERLAHFPNIVGIKEATGHVDRAEDIRQRCGDSVDVLSGDDPTALALMKVGAKGVISVTANVVPQLMHNMATAYLQGDLASAEALDQQLQALHRALFVESNPIPVKWALQHMDLIERGIRLPLTWLTEAGQAELMPILDTLTS